MTINLLTQLDLHTIPQCIHTCLSQFANCLYYSIQLATPTLAPSLTSTPTMAQSQPQLENSTPQPAHNTPLALTLNCGYFRTAIRELVPKRKGIHGRTFEISKLTQELSELFSVPGYGFETIQSCPLFEKKCNQILNAFSRKWHPSSARRDYEMTFTLSKWKTLPDATKRMHSLSN